MSQPILKQAYFEKIVPELRKLHGYKNIHEVPRLEKIVLNSGFAATLDKKEIAETQKELSAVAGQQAVITKARKSVSNFKLRDGMPVGTMVTLRGNRMYEFLYEMISIALPGIRDFRGVSEKLDGNGNYAIGIADHSIFPEIHSDGSKRTMGMDVCIVTTAESDAEGRDLLRLLGMPFRNKQAAASAA